MYYLRSCSIIYEDFVTKKVNECDGITSLFTMPNISTSDMLFIFAGILITIYFVLKTIMLFKKD